MAVPMFVHAQAIDDSDFESFLEELGKDKSVAAGSLDTDVLALSSPPLTKDQHTFYANPGPWGKLKCFYVFLEAPLSMVQAIALPSPKTRWSFPVNEGSKLPALFKKAGLPETFAAALGEQSKMSVSNGMLNLFPSLAEVEAMTPAMRQVIYTELAKYPLNEQYANPTRILTDTFDEWFRTTKLRPEIVAKIRQMSYFSGGILNFCDKSALLNFASGEAEARQIFKAFTRTRTLMVQLELDSDSDLEELLSYWTVGVGSRRKDIEPIMQSIIDVEGVENLGLPHILPALPRKLLYTFSGDDQFRYGHLPDCHWTSLNFFNYEPHNYLLDSRLATLAVLDEYDRSSPPFKYGDILMFLDPVTSNGFHSCVYLADDMVFSKNGHHPLSPWVIVTLDELRKVYFQNRDGLIQNYRHKRAVGMESGQ